MGIANELRITRGDEATFRATVYNADGTLLNLTGASAWFTAKEKTADSDATAKFQKTIGSGITVISTGILHVILNEADTKSLSNTYPTQLVWDLQVQDAAGTKVTVASGKLWVNPEVTIA